MKRLLVASAFLAWLLIAFLLPSCAPRGGAVPSFVPKAAVVKQEDTAPAISKAKEASSKADTASAVTKTHIEAADRTAAFLREALGKSVTEADRLRKQGSATQQDLTSLWIDLTNTVEKNRILTNDLANVSASFLEERELRNAAASAMDRAETVARSKDREAGDLRLNLTDCEANRKAIHTTNQHLSIAAQAANARADKLAGEVGLYRIGLIVACSICVLCGLAWFAIKFLLPPRLF